MFKSYLESGIRAVHAGAPCSTGVWEEHLPEDLIRLRDQYCSDPDSLISVRMFIDMRRVMPAPDLFAFARKHGFGITMDGVMGQRCEEIVELGRDGLLGPDVTLIHCNAMPEEGWRHIAEAGTRITLATTSEEALGLGDGVPVIQEALDHGIRPCLSGDVEVCLAGDMFTQMRTTLTTQRMMAKMRKYRGLGEMPALIDHRDIIEFATLRAAEAAGLADKIGTLTPGKYADLIAIRAEDLNNMPVNNAIGTIVLATESHNIDMVFVAGGTAQMAGQADRPRHRRAPQLVHDSRDYVAAKVGFDIRPTRKIELKHDEIQHRHAGYFAAIDDLLAAGREGAGRRGSAGAGPGRKPRSGRLRPVVAVPPMQCRHGRPAARGVVLVPAKADIAVNASSSRRTHVPGHPEPLPPCRRLAPPLRRGPLRRRPVFPSRAAGDDPARARRPAPPSRPPPRLVTACCAGAARSDGGQNASTILPKCLPSVR